MEDPNASPRRAPGGSASHHHEREQLLKRIEKEKNTIAALSRMRQLTTNAMANKQNEALIEDAQGTLRGLEALLQRLDLRSGQSSSLSTTEQTGAGNNNQQGYGAPSDYGNPGPGGYSQGNSGLMPPRAPYAPSGPADRTPRARPKYSKLGKWM